MIFLYGDSNPANTFKTTSDFILVTEKDGWMSKQFVYKIGPANIYFPSNFFFLHMCSRRAGQPPWNFSKYARLFVLVTGGKLSARRKHQWRWHVHMHVYLHVFKLFHVQCACGWSCAVPQQWDACILSSQSYMSEYTKEYC